MFKVTTTNSLLRVVGNDIRVIRLLYFVAFAPFVFIAMLVPLDAEFWRGASMWIVGWLFGIWLADERVEFVFDKHGGVLRWRRWRRFLRPKSGEIKITDIIRAELRESTQYQGVGRWTVVIITRVGGGTGCLPLTSASVLNGSGDLDRVAKSINDFLATEGAPNHSLQARRP